MRARQFCQWSAPVAEADTVLCVGLHLEDMAAWASQCEPFTTGSERHEASRFVHMEDAARHLAGRALARRMLCAATGHTITAPFARSPYGKPFCPQTSMDFSISHCTDMVWVALCRTTTVGIDLEQLRPLPDAAQLTSQLHPQERQSLLALPDSELEKAFFRCWTRKEAVLKACGTGLNTPLNSFCVHTGTQQNSWILSPPADSTRAAQSDTPATVLWTSHDISTTATYQCSVAASSPHLEVLAQTF